ncbi:MAG: alpha/beta hydrolase [Methylocystis sp.]|jgi:pimeloyl-ACP methyl ester carboxylesterase|nr:alpha/beta hydrolase [Methylocystis sp.]MCA3583422.1 alpha/beta hydrolase [Methylocystis sp.]MCA3589123.1 alpha/beta hydrolase [Methylocystis sp.]MCA3591941.1 alpha/beta hydrolase [Methylocystis sp.]
MKTFICKRYGWKMRYHDLPGHGAPLIFIHGLGCASSCDYPQIASDAVLAGRRMLLVDLLGFGFSDHPADFGYAIDDHARNVADLVDALACGSIDLYGHSMGGTVAIVAARLLGARVRRLVLSEPNLDAGGGRFSRKIAAFPEADFIETGHSELVKSSISDGHDLWASTLRACSPLAAHRGAACLVAGSHPPWREQLYALTSSNTVLFGESSLPHRDTERLPKHGVRVDVVPSAGHAMSCENPAGLARAIQKALA